MSIACRACGEPIDFLLLPSGRRMPVDGDQAETWYIHPRRRLGNQVTLVTDEGKVIQGERGLATDPGVLAVQAREAHWANCTHGEQFRQRKP